jgi:hypothetical protein
MSRCSCTSGSVPARTSSTSDAPTSTGSRTTRSWRSASSRPTSTPSTPGSPRLSPTPSRRWSDQGRSTRARYALPPVPSATRQVDSIPDETHALAEQPLALFGVKVLRTATVRADDPVPGHRSAVEREHPTDLPRRAGSDVLGDVAVGHDSTGWDRFDAAQDTQGERVRWRRVAQRGRRPVSATSLASGLAPSSTGTGGANAPVAARSPNASTIPRT